MVCYGAIARLALLPLWASLPHAVAQPASEAQEADAFGRRACKFRPLPSSLQEGYTAPDGSVRVAETFGAPLAALLDGHVASAILGTPMLLGLAVQLPFESKAQILVEAAMGQKTLKCTHTWGAGGHMKQCSLSRIQVPAGPLALSFRALLGGLAEPGCVPLRLDLELSPQQVSERARSCPQSQAMPAAPPLLVESGTDASIALASYSTPAQNGVIWKTLLPAAGGGFRRLFARITFPSMVHPLRILVEELDTSDAPEPRCKRRCFTGTAITLGQVVQRVLPPVAFALWILSDDHDASGIAIGGHCANYDFEMRVGMTAPERIAQEFLGPPALLCEGGAWPPRLEQVAEGYQIVPEVGSGLPLRQRRFALRDLLDLAPARDSSLEIQVAEVSAFRLTTHMPTVPARPVLVPGRRQEAWANVARAFTTRRIPAAGREFRHSISAELPPGEYTLIFVMEMATGGLKPCASVLLNLALEPLPADGGSCAQDVGNGALDLLAMAEPVPLGARLRAQSAPRRFSVTLPRPAGSYEEGAGDAEGLQILARSSMNLGYALEQGAPPVLLHAQVISTFSAADLQVTFYQDGQPLGEPYPLPDGHGYTAVAGPVVKGGFYEVVLFHVPRQGASSTSRCVDFSVDLAAVSLTPASAQSRVLAPLPGADTCWLSPELPTQIQVRPGLPTVVEGEYQLPAGGSATIQISGANVIVRAIISSSDAEVRIGQEPLELLGLAEDRHFYSGVGQPVALKAFVGPKPSACPRLRLQLVALETAAASTCSTATPLQALAQQLAAALQEQAAGAGLQRVAAVLGSEAGAGVASLEVRSPAAELRLELGLESPWLPLELVLLREGQEEKAWARAKATGQRLVMLLPSLPKGRYQLSLVLWAPVRTLPANKCCAVLGSVGLLAPKGRDTSNYRQEMLTMPELLAVHALPPKLVPGWWRVQDEFLGSEIFAVPAGGSSSSVLQLDAPAVLRLVAEPADILAPRVSAELRQGGQSVAESNAGGAGFAQLLAAGTYDFVLRSMDQADADQVPFFVTLGLAPAVEVAAAASACDGSARMMDLGGADTSESAWRWKRQLNLRSLPAAMKLPLKVTQPSIVTISAWSPFVHHYVRVALVTEEGLWVGEQRARRSALEIELPPGSFQMVVEEPSPLRPAPEGCMAVGVAVNLVPFTSVERPPVVGQVALQAPTRFLGAGLGLGAACDSLGAVPLPLDVISSTGGSSAYGGPIDSEGRLLLRERVMLTDIHDGRKKIFLRLPPASMLRAAVVSGDTASVEVVLEDSGHTQIHPVDSHVLGAGQAASYILEAGGGLWLSFHREHREAMGAGCAAFELLLQTAPLQDVVKMSSCGAQHSSLEELVLKALQHFGSSTVASAEAKVLTGPVGGNSAALHVALPEPSLLEVEVQFNFMLSNIHIWLDVSAGAGGGPALALGPTVSAQGLASAEKNTRAVLRLRLGAGEHLLRIRHDPAFPKEGGPVKIVVAGGSCAPLALKLRRAPLRKRLPIVDVPAAPVTPGADLVLQVSTASGALDLSSEPSLGNLPPAAAAQAAGALTLAWPSQSLARAEGRLVPAQDGFSRIWALPLRFEGGEAGEVWLALDALGSGRPWAGETAGAASPAAPPRAWPAPNEELPLPLPSAGRAEALLALPASPPNGGGIFTSRLLGWAAVLALLAYYTQNSAWLKAVLWRAGLQRRSFSQQLAAAEMTSPWSWPRDASSARDSRDADGVAASATARSARMYGTLDL